MAEDTDEHRRARILIAAGITPDACVSARAQDAIDTLMARPDDEVDALLAMLVLVVEARQPPQHPLVSKPPDGLGYPNPRPSVKRPGPPIW